MTACTASRAANASVAARGVASAPSTGNAPRNTRWLSTRLSSASSVRVQVARRGTSMPSSRSTASTTPSSEENAESQSWRLASTSSCR